MEVKREPIVYVDGKPHIKCGVVMLPTESKSYIYKNRYGIPQFRQVSGLTRIDSIAKNQHLYITSNEEIKEGDWVYNSISNELEKWSYKGWIETPDFEYLGYFKIIATTDNSLISINEQYFDVNKKRKSAILEQKNLPQLSQQFIKKYIEEYNKSNIITEVLVEVILDEWKSKDFRPVIFHDIDKLIEAGYNPKFNFIFKKGGLELDSQNQITIREQKDSWTREELPIDDLKLIVDIINNDSFKSRYLGEHGRIALDNLNKWVKKNL